MEIRLDGEIVVVTGGGGVLCGAMCKAFAAAGARVGRGSKVDITIATKKPAEPKPPAVEAEVAVPDIVGMSLGAARTKLRDAGLVPGAYERKKVPGARRGRIAEQTPAAGTKVPKGSKVDMVLAF